MLLFREVQTDRQTSIAVELPPITASTTLQGNGFQRFYIRTKNVKLRDIIYILICIYAYLHICIYAND